VRMRDTDLPTMQEARVCSCFLLKRSLSCRRAMYVVRLDTDH